MEVLPRAFAPRWLLWSADRAQTCVARAGGLEPPTFGFEVRRSIQLSYARSFANNQPTLSLIVASPRIRSQSLIIGVRNKLPSFRARKALSLVSVLAYVANAAMNTFEFIIKLDVALWDSGRPRFIGVRIIESRRIGIAKWPLAYFAPRVLVSLHILDKERPPFVR